MIPSLSMIQQPVLVASIIGRIVALARRLQKPVCRNQRMIGCSLRAKAVEEND
jgi:hypothetical protein